ncbi:response regulator transcription factor [Oceanobacillus halotolerans]|uniref:response regulator transcription factor n=1 Tax=Oceanobacillus halotolerans TaxID=2663380 RepID=UPI0013DC9B29|nr:response regulator transcription factor [Oceanobacillus halotolerans]
MCRIMLMKKPGLMRDSYPMTSIDASRYNTFFNYSKLPHLLIVEANPDIYMEDVMQFCQKHGIKVGIWITNSLDEKQLRDSFKLRAAGYFYDEMEASEMVFAVKKLLNGSKYIHSDLASFLLNEYIKLTLPKEERPDGILSKREWEVLELLVKGNTKNSIAMKLSISFKTLNNHLTSIYRKLDVTGRTEAVLVALQN